MSTKTTIKLIICANILIYCSCATSDSQKQDRIISIKSEMAKNTKRPKVDPRATGGDKSEDQIIIEKAMKEINQATDPILGYWVGLFGKNRINLALSSISGTTIEGHSVCAGNYRPIKGTIKINDGSAHEVSMSEPGDDKFDGKFWFKVDLNKMEINGDWTPFKTKGTSMKNFKLVKKSFDYDPSVGDYPETSQRLLTEEDVENHSSGELEIMRNEIYARHGYSFKSKRMRQHFEEKEWYMPLGVDIRQQLSKVEVENIALIYRYEEYYKVNYDDYGR